MLYFNGLGAIQSYKQAYIWAAISAANGNTFGNSIRQQAEALLSRSEVDEARKETSSWGTGTHSTTLRCRTSDGLFDDSFKIDLDTLTVEYNGQKAYEFDVSDDGERFVIHSDYVRDEFDIVKSTGNYSVKMSNGKMQFGKCERQEDATVPEADFKVFLLAQFQLFPR
jgi:hypothetical protein